MTLIEQVMKVSAEANIEIAEFRIATLDMLLKQMHHLADQATDQDKEYIEQGITAHSKIRDTAIQMKASMEVFARLS